MKVLSLSKDVPRKEVIEMMITIAGKAAKKYGFADSVVGEDRQKGIWGEGMTRLLEKEYGECSKEVKWSNAERGGAYVEFRFRFATPCVGIMMSNGDFANIEVSNYQDTDWRISEFQVFHPEGIGLMKYLIRLWNDAVRKKEDCIQNGLHKEVQTGRTD